MQSAYNDSSSFVCNLEDFEKYDIQYKLLMVAMTSPPELDVLILNPLDYSENKSTFWRIDSIGIRKAFNFRIQKYHSKMRVCYLLLIRCI